MLFSVTCTSNAFNLIFSRRILTQNYASASPLPYIVINNYFRKREEEDKEEGEEEKQGEEEDEDEGE